MKVILSGGQFGGQIVETEKEDFFIEGSTGQWHYNTSFSKKKSGSIVNEDKVEEFYEDEAVFVKFEENV